MRMVDLNKKMLSCSALSVPDAGAWSSFFLSWKAINDYWRILQDDRASLVWGPINTVEEGLVSDSIYAQMSAYASQMDPATSVWIAKLQKACPGAYTPPPAITTPSPAAPSKTGELIQYGITGVIAVAVAAVLYKGIQLADDLAGR